MNEKMKDCLDRLKKLVSEMELCSDDDREEKDDDLVDRRKAAMMKREMQGRE